MRKIKREAARRFMESWQRIDMLYTRLARHMGLNVSATLVLEALSMGGEPYTQKSLCDKFGIPKQALNAIINTLRENGYVQLTEAADRRVKHIHLTDAGMAYAIEIEARFHEVDERIWQQYTAVELQILADAIEKYEAAFADATKIH
jgi:DNA-binding MarR family transcriptional regulator